MCFRRCSIFAFCVAFKDLGQVKSVPGICTRKPTFTERYIYWRGCTICACLTLGIVLIVLMSVALANDFMTWDAGVKKVPAALQDDFKYFWIAEHVGGMMGDAVFVISILFMWAAAVAKRQKDAYAKVKTAWLLLILGPFLPFTLIPYAAFIDTDKMQADICAQTVASMIHFMPLRVAFRVSALSVGELELANVALFPPPRGLATSDEFKAWPGHKWCRDNVQSWEEALFSTAWIQSSMRMSPDSEPPGTMSFTRQRRVGVIPPAINSMVHACGGQPSPYMEFCYDDAKMQKADAEIKAKKEEKKDELLEIASRTGTATASGAADAASQRQHPPLMRRAEGEPSRSRQVAARQRYPDVSSLAVDAAGGLRTNPAWYLEQSLTAIAFNDMVGQGEAMHRAMNVSRASLSELAAALGLHGGSSGHEEAQIPMLGEDGACLTAVCAFYSGCVLGSRMARSYGQIAGAMGGQICKALTYKGLFFAQFSIIDGIIVGCINVKRIMPSSSLPGYVLSFAVIGSLPLVMFTFALLTQQLFHPLFACGVGCFVLHRAYDMTRADILTRSHNHKKIEKDFAAATSKAGMIQKLGLVFLVAYAGRMFWLVQNGHIIGTVFPPAVEFGRFDLRSLFTVPSVTIMLFKFIYTKLATKLCSTDLLMKAIFDAATNELGGRDENHEDVIQEWGTMMGVSASRFSKNKKEEEIKELDRERKLDPRTEEKFTFDEFEAQYKDKLSQEEIKEYWDDFLKPTITKREELEAANPKLAKKMPHHKAEGGLLAKLPSIHAPKLPFSFGLGGKKKAEGDKTGTEGDTEDHAESNDGGGDQGGAGDDKGASSSGARPSSSGAGGGPKKSKPSG